MKKQLLIPTILLIFSFTNFSFSQNGYKDAKWGMNIEKVKSLGFDVQGSGTESDFFGFAAAFYYETGKLNSASEQVDPLLEYYKSNALTYLSSKSGEDNLMFYFANDALVAVELILVSELKDNVMLSELEKKYGKSKTKYFEYFHSDAKINLWSNSGDRIILFMNPPNHDSRIVYLDKKFYQTISKRMIILLAKEKNSNTNFVQKQLNYYKKFPWYTKRDVISNETNLTEMKGFFGFESADDFSLGSLLIAHVYQNNRKPIESYSLNEYNVEPGINYYFTDEDELVEIRIRFKDYSLKINENLEKKFGKVTLKRYARPEVAFENTRIIKAWYNLPETIVTYEHTATGYDFVNFLSKDFYNALIDYAVEKSKSELKKKSQKID